MFMNYRLPYQYQFEAAVYASKPVDVKTVPDDTLTPKEIIVKFSKGLKDSRVSAKEPEPYLTAECGVPGGENGVKSHIKQDDLLLGVQLPDPSFDYTEFEEFSKKSSKVIQELRQQAVNAAKAKQEPPAPPAPPAPAE